MEGLHPQRVEERVMLDFNLYRRRFATIQNAGDLAIVAQAAARTRALRRSGRCNDFHRNTPE